MTHYNSDNNKLTIISFNNPKLIIGKLGSIVKHVVLGKNISDLLASEDQPQNILLTVNKPSNNKPNKNIGLLSKIVELEKSKNRNQDTLVLSLQIIDRVEIFDLQHINDITYGHYKSYKDSEITDDEPKLDQVIFSLKRLTDSFTYPALLDLLCCTKMGNYCYNLAFEIAEKIKTKVTIDNYALLLENSSLLRLEFIRQKLIEYYLPRRQQLTTSDLKDKVINNNILPVIKLDVKKYSSKYWYHPLLPLNYMKVSVVLDEQVKQQVLQCMEYKAGQKLHAILIHSFDQDDLVSDLSTLGVLSKISTVFSRNRSNVEEVILESYPESIVYLTNIHYLNQNIYAEIKEQQYYISSSQDELMQLVRECFFLLYELSILKDDKIKFLELDIAAENCNFIQSLSLGIIREILFFTPYTLVLRDSLLTVTNLAERFRIIKNFLIEYITLRKRNKVLNESRTFDYKLLKIKARASEQLPAEYYPIFPRYHLLPFFSLTTYDHYLIDAKRYSLAEHLLKLYYQGKKTIILVQDCYNIPTEDMLRNALQATVNSVEVTTDDYSTFCLTPEKRVKIVDVVSYDDMFYAKVENVEEIVCSLEEQQELNLLTDKIVKLLKLYKGNVAIPVFTPEITTIENYAASLAFYLENEILSDNFANSIVTVFNKEDIFNRLKKLVLSLQGENKGLKKHIADRLANISSVPDESNSNSIYYPPININSYTTVEEWVSVAKIQTNLELYDKAISSLDNAININANDAKIYIFKGYVLIRLTKYQEAIELFDKAVKLNLESTGTNGISQENAFDYQGLAYFNLGNYEEAIKCYDKLLELDSANKAALFNKAKSLSELRKSKEAIECLDRLIKLDPNYGSSGCISAVLGTLHYSLENYQEAIKCYDRALELGEVNEDWQLDRIFCGHKLEEQQKIVQVLDKILSTNTHSQSALIFKANILNELKEYDEALKCAEQLLEFSPQNAYALYHKGIAYYGLDNKEEAIKFLTKATELDTAKERWQLDRALCLHKLHKLEESIEAYDKILSVNPRNINALSFKACALNDLEKYNEALNLYQSVIETDPKHACSWHGKGWTYYCLKNYQEAIKCYNKALELDPNNSPAHKHKFMALEAMQRLVSENNLDFLVENTPLSETAKLYAIKELEIIKSLNSSNNEKADHIKYLQELLKLPWGKYDDIDINLTKARGVLEQEHFGLQEVKSRILESLVFMARSTAAKSPILCLVGPPGVGKTSIAHSIANALQRKCVSLSLAGAHDASLIRGCMNFYRSASCGKILSLITEAGTCNPVMILDELDKVDLSRGSGIEGAVLQLLDPQQNFRFTDDYFDFPFDLSKVMFIATANSLDKVSYPLINRMEVIELSGYTDQEKLHIVKKHLLTKLFKEAKLTTVQLKISDNIIKHLIKYYTKESGVRDIEKILRELIQKYLLNEITGKTQTLGIKLIEGYFGMPKYQIKKLNKEPEIGVAVGLAHTAMGGAIIMVEAEKIPGDGKIKATGKLGEVLKESVEAAYTHLKSNSKELGIKEETYNTCDLHIHLPAGATPKDGPSAGVTIYTAMVSILSGKKVKHDIAMTGEITLRGKILPIGGLKEKLSAAVREGIKTVIIPEDNKRDLAKIPDELKQQLTIKTIAKASELLELVFI